MYSASSTRKGLGTASCNHCPQQLQASLEPAAIPASDFRLYTFQQSAQQAAALRGLQELCHPQRAGCAEHAPLKTAGTQTGWLLARLDAAATYCTKRCQCQLRNLCSKFCNHWVAPHIWLNFFTQACWHRCCGISGQARTHTRAAPKAFRLKTISLAISSSQSAQCAPAHILAGVITTAPPRVCVCMSLWLLQPQPSHCTPP